MSSESDLVAQARAILLAQEEAAFAQSPFVAMPDWIAAGAPPRRADLQALGYTAGSERQELRLVRRAYIRRWGWSIPCAEAVAALRELEPLVEIGAGTGYLTAMMRAAGHDAIATDLKATGEVSYQLRIGEWAPSEALGAPEAVAKYPGRDVLCAWPAPGEAWSGEAAAAMAPGRHLALVGKARGQDTGSEALFDLLHTGFVLEAEVEIPQFPGETDALRIYRRL